MLHFGMMKIIFYTAALSSVAVAGAFGLSYGHCRLTAYSAGSCALLNFSDTEDVAPFGTFDGLEPQASARVTPVEVTPADAAPLAPPRDTQSEAAAPREQAPAERNIAMVPALEADAPSHGAPSGKPQDLIARASGSDMAAAKGEPSAVIRPPRRANETPAAQLSQKKTASYFEAPETPYEVFPSFAPLASEVVNEPPQALNIRERVTTPFIPPYLVGVYR